MFLEVDDAQRVGQERETLMVQRREIMLEGSLLGEWDENRKDLAGSCNTDSIS